MEPRIHKDLRCSWRDISDDIDAPDTDTECNENSTEWFKSISKAFSHAPVAYFGRCDKHRIVGAHITMVSSTAIWTRLSEEEVVVMLVHLA